MMIVSGRHRSIRSMLTIMIEIDLIPRVGNHVIHLGTTENLEGKLRNLEAFYDKVLTGSRME